MITINEISLFPNFEPTEIKLIYTLILCVIFDIILGVLKSIHKKELSSKVGIKGITKHFAILLLVILGKVVMYNLDLENLVAPFTLFYILFYAVSITESLAKLGIPIPSFITDRLEQLKEDEIPEFKIYEE